MTKKLYVTKLVVAISLVVAILVAGTFLDLSISKVLCILPEDEYYCHNFFVAFFEIFGECVVYVMAVVALAIIYNFFSKKETNRTVTKNVIMVVCVILELVAIFYCFHKILKNAYNHTSVEFETFFSHYQVKIGLVVLGGLIAYLATYAFSKFSQEALARLVKWALIVVIVLALSNAVVQGLKLVMHRTRYRTMIFVGDTEFSYYTNWFVINKNTFQSVVPMASDFFKSFPSGHACAGASIFLLCLLPKFTEKHNTKGWKLALIAISVIYSFALCLSRVMCGAHFFTDVFLGTFATVGFMFLINLWYKKRLNKTFDKLENF